MKKFTGVIFSLALFILAAPISSASATTSILITDKNHVALDGRFFDDDLATSLLPNGPLGQLIFTGQGRSTVWQIDPALVDEVSAMSAGYKLVSGAPVTGKDVATNWLAQLKRVTNRSTVIALAYGNPSGYWIHRLSPHDQSFLLTIGATHLEKALGRPVIAATEYSTQQYFHLDSDVVQAFSDFQKALQKTASFMASDELEGYRIHGSALFNPAISRTDRQRLASNLRFTSANILQRIRLSTGRFTITATHQKLPVTVINDFTGQASVTFRVNSINERIGVTDPAPMILAPKSKSEILIPVQVVSSGATALVVEVRNTSGDLLGNQTIYPISVRVISPIATWITTGAAITLFAAAIIQSARRIKRGRK
jgi:hypothetical protein